MKIIITAMIVGVLLLKPPLYVHASSICPNGYGYDSNGDGKITSDDHEPTNTLDQTLVNDTYNNAVIEAIQEASGYIDNDNIQKMLRLMKSCNGSIPSSDTSCIPGANLPDAMRYVMSAEVRQKGDLECVGWAKSVFADKKNSTTINGWGNAADTLANAFVATKFKQVYTNNATELKPGMYVIYPKNSDNGYAGHIAYVVAINPEKKLYYTTEANYGDKGALRIREHPYIPTIYGYLEFK